MAVKVSGVYVFLNCFTQKVYVGSAKDVFLRRRVHLNDLRHKNHTNTKFQRSWLKHGSGVWAWFVVEKCEPVQTVLEEREQYWMGLFNAVKSGYNICPKAGSPGGRPHTQESRAKISKAAKVSQVGENNGFYGRKHDEQTRLRLIANLEKYRSKSIEGTRRAKKGKSAVEIYGTEVAAQMADSVVASNRRRSGCILVFNPYDNIRRFVRPEVVETLCTQGWIKGHINHFRGHRGN